MSYHHTQRAPLCFLIYALGITLLVLGFVIQDAPPLRYLFPPLGLMVLVLAASFHHLTVADEGDRLAIQFGPVPLFQRRVKYDDIQSVEVGRTTLLDGWGIHMSLRGGWVWNLWGWDCVVLRLRKGTLRVGTNDADGLAKFVKTKMNAPAQTDENSFAATIANQEGLSVNQHTRRLGIFAFILLGLSSAIVQAEAAEPTDDVQVLFIGNSFTFFHEMPKMVAELAKAGKQRPLRFAQIAPGGYTLERHWKDGKALAALQSRKWDFVVLQEQSLGPILNKESMFEYGKKLDAEIQKQGAKTLLYMTWAYQDKPGDQMALSNAYLDLAKEINAEVVPVGLAWEQSIQADENRTLHENDKRHPNVIGSYLAACVFYATIYGQSPEGLPGRIGKLTNEKALPLQAIAWKVATDSDGDSLRKAVED